MFHDYNQYGKLYIILIKSINKRFQFYWDQYEEKHTETQFMDDKDHEVNLNELAKIYPILYTIFDPISKEHNSLALQKSPSSDQIEKCINSDPEQIQFIINPTVKEQRLAVEARAATIQYIKTPDITIQFLVVEDDPINIGYIVNPAEAVQIKALKLSTNIIQTFKSINSPTKKVINYYNQLVYDYLKKTDQYDNDVKY